MLLYYQFQVVWACRRSGMLRRSCFSCLRSFCSWRGLQLWSLLRLGFRGWIRSECSYWLFQDWGDLTPWSCCCGWMTWLWAASYRIGSWLCGCTWRRWLLLLGVCQLWHREKYEHLVLLTAWTGTSLSRSVLAAHSERPQMATSYWMGLAWQIGFQWFESQCTPSNFSCRFGFVLESIWPAKTTTSSWPHLQAHGSLDLHLYYTGWLEVANSIEKLPWRILVLPQLRLILLVQPNFCSCLEPRFPLVHIHFSFRPGSDSWLCYSSWCSHGLLIILS